ncbi:MAG: MBL fold metallo-hydrolase [Gemmatimonadetes bacterium]|nr:MBL fold metallo-hydrolase [Gemmatimonadota bacterium]NNM07024.1 MBL fold metallo-hydrolase [Gemmatimonadota bacterium]
MTEHSHPTRRGFIKTASACAAHAALMATPFPAAARTLWSERTQGRVVAQEPFGRLESLSEGLWALVSTPLGGDYTTVSNGGILAGTNGVLVIEAFQTPEGALWMAEKARELTGRWPTHVLVTHYHGDHSNGAQGFFPDGTGPSIHVTGTTRRLKREGMPADTEPLLRGIWEDAVLLAEDRPGSLDLGGRTVLLSPWQGHTSSDVTVSLPDEGVTWCGDLVWNGMFPNYMDATPSQLSRAVRAIQSDGSDTYVPGHGPLAKDADMSRYLEVINGIEETARTARREGWTAEEAGARHEIREDLGEWTLFNPSYFQRAVEAWMKEWSGG